MEAMVRFDTRTPSKPVQHFDNSPSKAGTAGNLSRFEDVSPSSAGMPLGDPSTASEAGGAQTISTQGGFYSNSWRHTLVGVDMKGRNSKQRETKGGAMDMVKIKSVVDVYKAVRILVGMISNCWVGHSSAGVQVCNPGLAKVRVGDDTYVVPGFLLQDMDSMVTQRPSSTASGHGAGSTLNMNPTLPEVTVRVQTPYFKHVILLLKLRWLLRLHSACCELDYKMCSCATLIKGLQLVSLQQCAEMEADSIFDKKVHSSLGQHVNMESVVDDVFDQLQRSMGPGWKSFLEYASTCDPARCVHNSRMDMGAPQIVSNSPLMTVIDTIFVANFLRMRYGMPASDLEGCFHALEDLGVPVPELPPLRGAQHLRTWAKAKTRPTRQDRDRANKKDIEKLAQLDAVLLCCAMELRSPEVLATSEEIAEMEVSTQLPKSMAGDLAPEPEDFGSTGRSASAAGPPAARVMLVDKPKMSPALFNAVVHLVHHHVTFPQGIRERLYRIVAELYGLSREQSERLAIAVTQNIDGQRLPTQELLKMEEREKKRLHTFEVESYRNCAHLLVSPLVAAPEEKSKPARYTLGSMKPMAASGYSSRGMSEMNRSLPDLSLSRGTFKVPLSTGPLTMDPDLNKLRTTGFFIRMPPLK